MLLLISQLHLEQRENYRLLTENKFMSWKISMEHNLAMQDSYVTVYYSIMQ